MRAQIDRDRLAIQLKTWLRSQDEFKTIRALEAPTGIPYSSLKDYFSGHAAPTPERLKRLCEITGLTVHLKPEADRPAAGVATPSEPRQTAQGAAVSIRDGVRRLMDELDYFKRGTEADRAVLKSLLPARDVGYLTTLLKAMYDEDQFQAWVYFSQYTPEGD